MLKPNRPVERKVAVMRPYDGYASMWFQTQWNKIAYHVSFGDSVERMAYPLVEAAG